MPHHLGDIQTRARVALITGDPDRVATLADAVGRPKSTWSKRGFVCTETHRDGDPVLIAATGIGGPATAIVAEELWQLGARQIIRLGTCGAMEPPVKAGNLIVSTGAVRDEGTSHQYLPSSVPAIPDPDLLARLVAEARARGTTHHVGLTHSKDAYYAERPEGLPLRGDWEAKWAVLRAIGVLATEMEAAALFAVATVRRFQAAAILVPVDDTISAADVRRQPLARSRRNAMKVLITGGAGFIGCNLALGLIDLGHRVTVADNLSRHGSEQNVRLAFGRGNAVELVAVRQADVRDPSAIANILTESKEPYDAVVHLAGQTTVTESVTYPVDDFDVNARGTLMVLEAVRRHAPSAHVIFASTNKVYGDLRSIRVKKTQSRFTLPDYPEGIPESFPTNAVSPYGCSKLAADNYVRDYATTYGMATTVFRLSCIYGRWQNGMPGQGWVSWFVRCALTGAELTIYGDGLQTRDLLHIQDLVDAFIPVITDRQGVGETFNAGGGPAFSLSVWAEFGPMLEELADRPVNVRFAERRIGDQDVYISNYQELSSALGWKPRLSPRDGTGDLVEWMAGQLRDQR